MPNVQSRYELSAPDEHPLDHGLDGLGRLDGPRHRPDSRILQAFAGGAFFAAAARDRSPAGFAMALCGGLLLWLAATQDGPRHLRAGHREHMRPFLDTGPAGTPYRSVQFGAELQESRPRRARDAAPPVT